MKCAIKCHREVPHTSRRAPFRCDVCVGLFGVSVARQSAKVAAYHIPARPQPHLFGISKIVFVRQHLWCNINASRIALTRVIQNWCAICLQLSRRVFWPLGDTHWPRTSESWKSGLFFPFMVFRWAQRQASKNTSSSRLTAGWRRPLCRLTCLSKVQGALRSSRHYTTNRDLVSGTTQEMRNYSGIFLFCCWLLLWIWIMTALGFGFAFSPTPASWHSICVWICFRAVGCWAFCWKSVCTNFWFDVQMINRCWSYPIGIGLYSNCLKHVLPILCISLSPPKCPQCSAISN